MEQRALGWMLWFWICLTRDVLCNSKGLNSSTIRFTNLFQHQTTMEAILPTQMIRCPQKMLWQLLHWDNVTSRTQQKFSIVLLCRLLSGFNTGDHAWWSHLRGSFGRAWYSVYGCHLIKAGMKFGWALVGIHNNMVALCLTLIWTTLKACLY